MNITYKINQALNVAAVAHAKQLRKGSATPYIVHPFAVATIVSNYTDNEDAIIAALLHDVLEDASDVYPEAKMLQDFGSRVVEIVNNVSEKKLSSNGEEKPWKERKTKYQEHLSQINDNMSILVTTADKIHNLISMSADYTEIGDKLWLKFNASKTEQLWNYESILNILKVKSLPEDMINQLNILVDKLRAIVNN